MTLPILDAFSVEELRNAITYIDRFDLPERTPPIDAAIEKMEAVSEETINNDI